MFDIPTLPALVTRARNAFRANLPGSDAWLWPNNVNPVAKVLGGMASELFGFADWIQRQKFAITADGDNLDLHGAEINLGRQQPRPSVGTVTVTVADAYVVDFGAVFQRSDGVQFAATAGVSTLTAGTLSVPVASRATGAGTVTVAGTALQVISGVTDTHGDANATAAVAAGGIIGGSDVEADGAYLNPPPGTYRYRILFKKRNPPAGGAASDYVIWAQEANPNVTRVFVERLWAGFGTVRVSILMDDLYADGIPQPADIAQIAAYIDMVKPGGAIVSVVAPTAVPVAVTISGLTPSNPATQSAVQAELKAAFLRLAAVAGNDSANPAMPYLAVPVSFPRQWLIQAIDNASGVARFTTLSLPAVDVALSAGQIATLGALTFT